MHLFKKIIAIIIMVIIILTASYEFYNYFNRRKVGHTIDGFMEYINNGDLGKIQNFLYNPEECIEHKAELFIDDSHISYNKIKKVKLHNLNNAEATIHITIDDIDYSSKIYMKKLEKQWKVFKFLDISILTSALVTGISKENNLYTYNLFYQNEHMKLSSKINPDFDTGCVLFLIALENNVVYADPMKKILVSKLLSVNEDNIETESEGYFNISKNVSIYRDTDNKLKTGNLADLIPGLQNTVFYLRKDVVRGIMMPYKHQLQNIRVLIGNEDFSTAEHNIIEVSSIADFIIEDKIQGIQYKIPGGEIAQILYSEYESEDDDAKSKIRLNDETYGYMIITTSSGISASTRNRIYVYPSENYKLDLLTIKRGTANNRFTPSYRGFLEVFVHDKSLMIVNDLPVEQYLYSVIPSEMPLSFGEEALKVQSISARSYAVSAILNNNYRHYSAHLDDSVRSQVYNNISENTMANNAVNATNGIIAAYNGNPINATYFSTSCGFTASAHEVWSDSTSNQFPGKEIPYLAGKSHITGEETDLCGERNMKQFLTQHDYNCYDTISPYFRWQVTMSRSALEASINENLAQRQNLQPDFILTKNQQNGFDKTRISNNPVGKLMDLIAVQRGRTGNLMAIDIISTNGTYRVFKELNIRTILSPANYQTNGEDIILELNNGKTLINNSILPSAFVYFDIVRDEKGDITYITIYGGGNGHGVGMSQYGAYGMALQGYDFESILKHYYTDIELIKIY